MHNFFFTSTNKHISYYLMSVRKFYGFYLECPFKAYLIQKTTDTRADQQVRQIIHINRKQFWGKYSALSNTVRNSEKTYICNVLQIQLNIVHTISNDTNPDTFSAVHLHTCTLVHCVYLYTCTLVHCVYLYTCTLCIL